MVLKITNAETKKYTFPIKTIIVAILFVAVVIVNNFVLTSSVTKNIHYDPKKCDNMVDGHCDDANGGAWSYRTNEGACAHSESSVPRDFGASNSLVTLFPTVENVLDFGGGQGPYLLSFRDKGVSPLVIMEPQPLGECIFKGMIQDTTDLVNTPLKNLPKKKFDLVMSIEVVEHIPVEFHPHIVDALAQACKTYILFSAAHPGQGGEGHVGPSMKTRDQWVEEFGSRQPDFELDTEKMKEFHNTTGGILTTNAFILKRKGT